MLASLVRAGTITALIDGLWAVFLSVVVYGSTFSRLWQGVASTLIGPAAFDGGARTTTIGLMMHVGVAFFWSAVFLWLFIRWRWIRDVVASRQGALTIAAVYGPFIWMVMSLVVIPTLTGRPPAITARWWIQCAGHIAFVGMPIVLAVGRRNSR